jgi:hypothetical protein
MALSTMMKIKTNEISDAINSIPIPLRDTLMKYVYKGFENPKDYPSSALLTWHEKVCLLIQKRSVFSSIFFFQGSCGHWSWINCPCSN